MISPWVVLQVEFDGNHDPLKRFVYISYQTFPISWNSLGLNADYGV